ncbi:MAG: diguanylate cyclase [Actinomycetota bacterium]
MRRRRRWSNLPLRLKGFVIVALPVGGLLVAQAGFLIAQRTYAQAAQAAREAQETKSVIRSVLISTLDAEISVHGYLLTGERSHLYLYRQAVVALPQSTARLENLANGARELAAVDRIGELVGARMEAADRLRRRPRADQRQLLLQRGKMITGYLRGELGALQEREESELRVHQARADRYRSLATAVAGAGVILGLLGGVLATAVFTSGVTKRVRRLEDNTERMARGEPLRSLPPGSDEIGRLGRAMEEAAARLGETKGLLQGVIDGTSDVIYVKDLDGRYRMMNGAGRSYLDRPLEDIVGRTDDELYTPELASTSREHDRVVLDTGKTLTFETTDAAHGTIRIFLVTKGPVRDALGRVTGIFGIAHDITDREEAERAIAEMNEKLRQQAIIDDLTGLHNRRAFMAIGEHELRVADRSHRPLAVLFADLDGMKGINDLLGHVEGDRALGDAAEILRSTLRASDVVARLGGDEFCALLPDCPEAEAEVVLGRVDAAIREHLAIAHRPFDLSLSLGMAIHEPGTAESMESLIVRADRAMYEQKADRAVSS